MKLVCFILTACLCLALNLHAAVTVIDDWHMGESDPGAANGRFATNTLDSVGGNTLTNQPAGGLHPYYTNNVSSQAAFYAGSGLCEVYSNGQYAVGNVVPNLTTNFGMELWVNPAAGNAGSVIAYNGNTGGSGWGLYQNGANCYIFFGGVGFSAQSAFLATNKWTDLALVCTNVAGAQNVAILYTNGVAALSITRTPNSPSGNFLIGGDNSGLETFSGAVDEVRVFTFSSGQFSPANLLVNQPLVVTNTANSGPGSLRGATAAANAGNNNVTFAGTLSGSTLFLTNGPINLSTNLTIDASALPGGIQINGNHAFTIFSVASGVTDILNSLTITNGYSSANSAGIVNSGNLTLNECTVISNIATVAGAGIGNNNSGQLTINECTFAGNISASSGAEGGGIDNYGTLVVNESTFTGNSANAGGAIFTEGGSLLTVNECTICSNSSVGITLYTTSGNQVLLNSIVAGNVNGDIGTGGGPGFTTSINNLTGVNPMLAPLGHYGGPTQTMPPLPGSPAIGAGNVASNTFATDQRGYARTQNGLIDIGAVELPTVAPFTASPTNGITPLSVQFDSANVDSDGTAIIGWDWSFGDGNTNAAQNPTYVYSFGGKFSAGLIVTNSLGLVLAASGPPVIFAAGPSVITTADSGPGSLRWAVMNAFKGETITFAPNLSGQIIALAGTLQIKTNLTIDASALPGGIQINGNGAFTVFSVASGVTDILNSLTITNGYTTGNGGGILNAGNLTLNECTVISNITTAAGAGIENNNSGQLTINECTFAGNISASSGAEGGGIDNYGTLVVNESTFTGNSANGGGAIFTEAGSFFTVSGSTICSNVAYCCGGGISVYATSGNQVLLNSIVAGNVNGDIYGAGSLTINSHNLTGVDPMLVPLGNYGGPTQTMPPLPGSPAIGAGNVASNTFATDQRGYARTQNGLIDIGAVELPTAAPFTASPDYGLAPLNVQFASTNVDSDGTAITQWNWSFGDGNTSTNQNPMNVYSFRGEFSPGLIVTNSLGLELTVSGPVISVYPQSVVSTGTDSGAGSLRSAITQATNGETITFAPNLSGQTITLASTLSVNTNLTIDASALPGGIQINGNGAFTVFNVASGVTDVLNSLTITNGYTSGSGAGIINSGSLTLNQCTLSGNNSVIDGGGIYNGNTLALNQCTVAENSAANGGGIYNANKGTLNQCTVAENISDNEGGGIYNAGTLTLTNDIILENSNFDIYDTSEIYLGDVGDSDLIGSFTSPLETDNSPGSGLAPLGNYGGPTQTMPPLPGSPAIGAGDAAANTFTNDQRGYPRTQNGLIDIGAVELPTVPPFTATPTNGITPLSVQFDSANVDSDGTAIIGWNWSFGDGNTSTNQNPTNVYSFGGGFSPGLIVTNSLGLELSVSGPAIPVNALVTNANDSGSGSLRSALTNAFAGEIITFAPNLSGQIITLASTLQIKTDLTIDASALPGGIQINGSNAVQVLEVVRKATAVLDSITIAGGFAGPGDEVGGGIGLAPGCALTLNQCTLSGNYADIEGGAIYNNDNTAKLTLNQCTLSGNISGGDGGAIYGGCVLNQCTLSENSASDNGGGIYSDGALLAMTNTIVAGNTANSGGDISGSYSGGYDLVGVNPQLAPLGNYGGPTQTMPPLPGSPAIGAGSIAVNTFSNDQRGYPRTHNGFIDIGAVELPVVRPFAASPDYGLAPLNVQFASTNVDSDGSAITEWNWSFGDGDTGSGQDPSHVYTTSGILSPGLIVTNSLGLALAVSGPPISAGPLVTTNADSGPGSLRSAVNSAVNDEGITFAPYLAGQTITLSSALTINENLTIDASALPGGIQINGNGAVPVFSVLGGTVILDSLTITNGGQGGIYSDGALTLNQCVVSGNSGGAGIYNDVDGVLALNGCTLAGNSAVAIDNEALLALDQCTLSGNSGAEGGGIYNDGDSIATLNECTLSGNHASDFGGGIYNGFILDIANTIVAGNSAPVGGGPDIFSYFGPLGYSGANLLQSVTNYFNAATITGPAPLTNAPDLAPLGYYGGPTQTMPPLPGSPAIGAGSIAVNTFTNDQRGYPRTQNGRIDIGAVELPVVQFTASPVNDWLPHPVQFNAPAVDSDGAAITQWDWTFGDGNTSANQNPSDSYSTAGMFSPALIVTNSLGLILAASGPSISVYPPLALDGISISGTNLVIAGASGVSGLNYAVLTSTNLSLPLNQWTPLTTNTWTATGPFTLTLTNAMNPPAQSRFYLLQSP